MIRRARRASSSFSSHFWARSTKFSWWASPIEVKTTTSGRMIRSSRSISPGFEIPASKTASSSSPSSISTESGTPSCELKLLGER